MSFMTQDVRVNKGRFFENSVNGQSRLVHVIVNGRSGYETQHVVCLQTCWLRNSCVVYELGQNKRLCRV